MEFLLFQSAVNYTKFFVLLCILCISKSYLCTESSVNTEISPLCLWIILWIMWITLWKIFSASKCAPISVFSYKAHNVMAAQSH